MKLLNEMKLVHVSYQRVWNIHKDERELYIKILLENEETVIDEIKECAFPRYKVNIEVSGGERHSGRSRFSKA